MKYRGPMPSFEEMLAAAEVAASSPAHTAQGVDAGARFTAARNAAWAAELLRRGEGLGAAWRFGILQTVDDYERELRRGGAVDAARVFDDEPALTGSSEVDAAFAALADDFAVRDGWQAPAWAGDERRRVDEWFPSVPELFVDEARRDSPPAWRRRGIFITSRSLARA